MESFNWGSLLLLAIAIGFIVLGATACASDNPMPKWKAYELRFDEDKIR